MRVGRRSAAPFHKRRCVQLYSRTNLVKVKSILAGWRLGHLARAILYELTTEFWSPKGLAT